MASYPTNNCYLEHVNITTKDIEETKRFFLTAFPHWRVRGRGQAGSIESNNIREWMHVGDDQFYVALEASRETDNDKCNREPYYHVGINHAGFAVKENVNSIKKRLLDGGFQEGFMAEEHKYRQRVYFKDGTGNEFEFVEYFSDKSNERNLYPISAIQAANATSNPNDIIKLSNENEKNNSNNKNVIMFSNIIDGLINEIDCYNIEASGINKTFKNSSGNSNDKKTNDKMIEKKEKNDNLDASVTTTKTNNIEKTSILNKAKFDLSAIDEFSILPSMRSGVTTAKANAKRNNGDNDNDSIMNVKFNDSSNPMHSRRNRAIKVIYQFLEEEGLYNTLNSLKNETSVNDEQLMNELKTHGMLLESIDLRDAYYSSQQRTKQNETNLTKLLESRAMEGRTEDACITEKYSFSNFVKSNILCLEIFYDTVKDKPYLLFGTAMRSLYIIPLEYAFSDECKSSGERGNAVKLIGEFSSLKGPPLYIDIMNNRYALICCMDGTCYIVDLEYSLRHHYLMLEKESSEAATATTTEYNKNKVYHSGYWRYEEFKNHSKYVVMGKWSHDGKWFLTGSHDYSMNLYKFNDDYAVVSMARNERRLQSSFIKHGRPHHTYKFDGCVEAMEWINTSNTIDNNNVIDLNDCKEFENDSGMNNNTNNNNKDKADNFYEFVVAVRGDNYLHYYRMDNDDYDDSMDWQLKRKYNHTKAFIKCNINPFGDDHISYSIGDLKVSKDGKFLLAKTDQEKVLLFGCESDDILRIYYGSHSDQYTYTRCFISNKNKYIYASHHNSFVVWDIISGKMIDKINAHTKTLRDMIIDEKKWLFNYWFI